MPIWTIVILDLVIFYFFFGNYVTGVLRSRKMALFASLRDYEKHFRRLLARDEDILPPRQLTALREAVTELQAVRQRKDSAEAEKCRKKYQQGAVANLPPPPSCRWIRENLEILVVALGLAFGVRSLYVQPFKIPTGSMQPTLFGIHFQPAEAPYAGNKVQKFFSFLNYSRRHLDLVAQDAGSVDFYGIRPVPSWPFFPQSEVQVGSQSYLVPGTPLDIQKALYEQYGQFRHSLEFRGGETVLRGALESGDHLFVNRLSLCFKEPQRGDVMVFVTDGLLNPGGQPFGGRYYIKRLVGLPNDELLIKEHKLYVKAPGESEFRLLDKEDDPGFARIHSCHGGYHGYAHAPGAKYLRSNDDSFKVPPGQYFMLGDNSENSLDSRYWGTVPRENLVGTALLVWWPFSRRWGSVDRVEPLPHSTPPNLPAVKHPPQAD